MGLPVTPGFTISTEACRAYLATATVPGGMDAEVVEVLAALEVARGETLGEPDDRLLVSVRSGGEVLDARDDGDRPEPRASRYKHRGRTSTRQQRLT